jgi:hypothetical protein
MVNASTPARHRLPRDPSSDVKLSIESRECGNDRILADPDAQALARIAVGSSSDISLIFVLAALRTYDGARRLHDSALPLKELARQLGALTRRHRAEGERIIQHLTRLFQHFDSGRIRGAVFELIVEEALRPRYGSALLDNNAHVRAEFDDGRVWRSKPRSVDIFAWSQGEGCGEAIDCKFRAKRVAAHDIRFLRDEMLPLGVDVAIATADARDAARTAFHAHRVTMRGVGLIHRDNIRTALPLNRA